MGIFSTSRNMLTTHSLFSFRKMVLLILPLLATIIVIWKFFLVVDVPFRLDYAEGFIFTNTLSALDGESIYHSVQSAPYIFGFYTPLYNYIGAIFMNLFGSDISILRILTFMLYVATGVCVGFIVKHITKNVFLAVLSGLLFYSACIVSQWSSIARPDMLGLFFISLGIATMYAKRLKKLSKIFLVAFIFSLAFFSKQSFIFAPLAFFVSLLFINKKDALKFAGAYAFFVGLGILMLHLGTHGEATKQIFIYPSLVPYANLYAAFRIAALTAISALPLILLAIWKVVTSPKDFFSLYFICSLLSFFMLLRDGGIQNYLLEFILALVLLVGISIPWKKLQAMSTKLFYPLLVVFLFFFVLWSFASFPWETNKYIAERMNVFAAETVLIEKNSRVLAEDPLIAHATGATVEIDPYTFGQVAELGLIPTTEFFAEIKNGKYAYIDDYGAFGRIQGIEPIIKNNFQPVLSLTFSEAVKPFDYSIYNRNTITNIGTLYSYYSAEATESN